MMDEAEDHYDPHQHKRQRISKPSTDDILRKSRFIMQDDPFKERAPSTEDRHFRALFGCCVDVVLKLWLLLVDSDLVPSGANIKHLLWTLLFLKVYPTDSTMSRMTQSDPKTFRKWINLFLDSICFLESKVASTVCAAKWIHSQRL